MPWTRVNAADPDFPKAASQAVVPAKPVAPCENCVEGFCLRRINDCMRDGKGKAMLPAAVAGRIQAAHQSPTARSHPQDRRAARISSATGSTGCRAAMRPFTTRTALSFGCAASRFYP